MPESERRQERERHEGWGNREYDRQGKHGMKHKEKNMGAEKRNKIHILLQSRYL